MKEIKALALPATDTACPNSGSGSEIRVCRDKGLDLSFVYGPLNRVNELLARIGPTANIGCYVLEGHDANGRMFREGMSTRLDGRIAEHVHDLDKRDYTHILIVAGPRLTEGAIEALESLLSRQLANVSPQEHRSRPNAVSSVLADRQLAALAFRFTLASAATIGLSYLVPPDRSHPCSYWHVVNSLRDRFFSGSQEDRTKWVLAGAPVRGIRLRAAWGDNTCICEVRNDEHWLLHGSEIRARCVESARQNHKDARMNLTTANLAAAARGFPDRLELRTTHRVGWSLDAAQKFATGSMASRRNFWRPVDDHESMLAPPRE